MKKTRSKWFYAILVLFSAIFIAAVLVGFAGCSGCGGDEAEVESVTVTSSVSVEEGKTSTITASVKMSDDSSYDGSYSWSSSDTSIATVSGSGASATVTGVKAGSATVTVKVDDDKSATCSVTVTAASSESEKTVVAVLYTDSFDMYSGTMTAKDVVITLYDDGNANLDCDLMSGYACTYSISNGTMTFVIAGLGTTSYGAVTYDTDGTTILAVTFTNFAGIDQNVILAVEGYTPGTGEEPGGGEEPGTGDDDEPEEVTVKSVALDQSELSLAEGLDGTLKATVTMSDGSTSTSQTLAWSSSDKTVATVKSAGTTSSARMNGTVTAVNEGEATITVTVNGDSSLAASCTVIVTAPVAASVTLSKGTLDLAKDGTGDLEATVLLTNGEQSSDSTIEWASSVQTVATVTADSTSSYKATVTAVAAGETVVTATVKDTTISASCTVEVYPDEYILVLEAEDAALFNSPDSSMGSTEILGTEPSSSFAGVTQVKNFNVAGDRIVFQVCASEAISSVDLTAWVTPTNDDFDASAHPGFITVNGKDAGAAGTVAKSAYGAVTATISLNAGINYIEMILDVSGGSLFGMNLGYMNVDRIDLGWNDATSGSTGEAMPTAVTGSETELATITSVDCGGDVSVVPATGIATIGTAKAYLMNAVGATDNLMKVENGVISNITAGDEVVFQINSSVSGAVMLEIEPEAASALTVYLNGAKVSAYSNGIYLITLSSGVNYIELVMDSTATGSASVSALLFDGGVDFAGNFVTEGSSVTAPSGAYDYNGSSFTGSEVTSVEMNEQGQYVISGDAAFMTPDQLVSFWGDGASNHELAQYIAITIVANAGESFTVVTAKSPDGIAIDGSAKSVDDTFYTLLFDVTNYTVGGAWLFTIVDANGNEYEVVLGDITLAVNLKDSFVTGDYSESVTLTDSAADGGNGKSATFTGSSITVTFDGEKYIVDGTSVMMSNTQVEVFWGVDDMDDHAGHEFILVTIKAVEGTTFTLKSGSNEYEVDGSFTFIVDVDDHEEGWTIFTIVIGNNSYDVVLGEITPAAAE